MTTVADMADGKVKGYFVMGENPVVGLDERRAPAQGPARSWTGWWCATSQLTETAEFWRDAPEIERGEVRPEDIATEVFFFPAAAHTEKDGSSPTRSACCSGTTRRSSRRATAAASCTSSSTSGGGCKELYADSTRPEGPADPAT